MELCYFHYHAGLAPANSLMDFIRYCVRFVKLPFPSVTVMVNLIILLYRNVGV